MIRFLEGTIFIKDVELFVSKIREIRKNTGIVIQALDADKLAGERHLMFAVEKAMESFKTGTNVANDPAKEILLYASGKRQINRAVKIGMHNGMNNIVIVGIGDDFDLSSFFDVTPKNVLKYDISKKKALMEIFDITEEEITAAGEDKIPDLVIERVALVNFLK